MKYPTIRQLTPNLGFIYNLIYAKVHILQSQYQIIEANRLLKFLLKAISNDAERIRKQKPQQVGELVQIDHMVLNLYNGLHLRELSFIPSSAISNHVLFYRNLKKIFS